MAHDALHMLLIFVMPPLLLGIIARTKAIFAGRVGPPLIQPWWDIIKLMRKGSVFSKTTTWVFKAGPVVTLATALVAVSLVPLGAHHALFSFEGDLILFAYVLALGRFFTVAAALDTGSAFEGMGGAREVTFSCLAEPALFLSMAVLVRLSGSTSLSGMMGPRLGDQWSLAAPSLVAVGASLFVVLLAENSRIPFDDPNTHLELTMIHEVMVLDHGGPALAMILYGAALKLFLLSAVVVRLALPFGSEPWLDWVAFVFGMTVCAIVIGIIESTMARLRLVHVPNLLLAACVLSAFAVILLWR